MWATLVYCAATGHNNIRNLCSKVKQWKNSEKYQMQRVVFLHFILAVIEPEAGYTLDRLPVHFRAEKHNHSHS